MEWNCWDGFLQKNGDGCFGTVHWARISAKLFESWHSCCNRSADDRFFPYLCRFCRIACLGLAACYSVSRWWVQKAGDVTDETVSEHNEANPLHLSAICIGHIMKKWSRSYGVTRSWASNNVGRRRPTLRYVSWIRHGSLIFICIGSAARKNDQGVILVPYNGEERWKIRSWSCLRSFLP